MRRMAWLPLLLQLLLFQVSTAVLFRLRADVREVVTPQLKTPQEDPKAQTEEDRAQLEEFHDDLKAYSPSESDSLEKSTDLETADNETLKPRRPSFRAGEDYTEEPTLTVLQGDFLIKMKNSKDFVRDSRAQTVFGMLLVSRTEVPRKYMALTFAYGDAYRRHRTPCLSLVQGQETAELRQLVTVSYDLVVPNPGSIDARFNSLKAPLVVSKLESMRAVDLKKEVNQYMLMVGMEPSNFDITFSFASDVDTLELSQEEVREILGHPLSEPLWHEAAPAEPTTTEADAFVEDDDHPKATTSLPARSTSKSTTKKKRTTTRTTTSLVRRTTTTKKAIRTTTEEPSPSPVPAPVTDITENPLVSEGVPAPAQAPASSPAASSVNDGKDDSFEDDVKAPTPAPAVEAVADGAPAPATDSKLSDEAPAPAPTSEAPAPAPATATLASAHGAEAPAPAPAPAPAQAKLASSPGAEAPGPAPAPAKAASSTGSEAPAPAPASTSTTTSGSEARAPAPASTSTTTSGSEAPAPAPASTSTTTSGSEAPAPAPASTSTTTSGSEAPVPATTKTEDAQASPAPASFAAAPAPAPASGPIADVIASGAEALNKAVNSTQAVIDAYNDARKAVVGEASDAVRSIFSGPGNESKADTEVETNSTNVTGSSLADGLPCWKISDRRLCCGALDGRADDPTYGGKRCIPAAAGKTFKYGQVCDVECYVDGSCAEEAQQNAGTCSVNVPAAVITTSSTTKGPPKTVADQVNQTALVVAAQAQEAANQSLVEMAQVLNESTLSAERQLNGTVAGAEHDVQELLRTLNQNLTDDFVLVRRILLEAENTTKTAVRNEVTSSSGDVGSEAKGQLADLTLTAGVLLQEANAVNALNSALSDSASSTQPAGATALLSMGRLLRRRLKDDPTIEQAANVTRELQQTIPAIQSQATAAHEMSTKSLAIAASTIQVVNQASADIEKALSDIQAAEEQAKANDAKLQELEEMALKAKII